MGRRGHHRLITTSTPRGAWGIAPPATLTSGTLTLTGQSFTQAIASALTSGQLVLTGGSTFSVPAFMSANALTLTGGTFSQQLVSAITAGTLTLTGRNFIAGALISPLTAGLLTFTGQWAQPRANGYAFMRSGLLVITGQSLLGAYHPHWRLEYEPMSYDVKLIRGWTAPGESVIWRLFLDRYPAEGAATVPVSAIAPVDISSRKFTVEVSGDVTMSQYRNNTVYDGNISDVVQFGPGGGAVQFTIEDWPQRTLADVALEMTAQVDTKVLTVNPVIANESFQRGGSLDGQLVMQKFLQTEDTDEEEYVEDLLNKGWNLAKFMRMIEKLDERVLRQERPEV